MTPNSHINADLRRAYREYVMIAFLYRRETLSRTELRNLTASRNWKVF